MAGGTLLPGRVDNGILSKYLEDFDPFFSCFLRFRRDWTDIISYIQKISPAEYGQIPPLLVQGNYTVKGDHGAKNSANEAALKAFEDMGIDPDFYALRDRAKDEVLPWDHLDAGVTKAFLWREWEKAQKEECTQDCRKGCVGCGMNRFEGACEK